MSGTPNARYPSHLAKLVAARLRERSIQPPPDKILLRLMETMYFASLKTDELRPCLCTVNYVDPQTCTVDAATDVLAGKWTTIRFRQPIPLTIRSLAKLAEAVEPTVSSLAVFPDESEQLLIWGMVDQELPFGDALALNAKLDRSRPGLFQVTTTGVGNLSVYKDYTLLGSLEHNNLIASFHDVLWQGPVHKRLKGNLRSTLANDRARNKSTVRLTDLGAVKDELLIRWQNAICRLLLNIQQHGHGGGLLIVPRCPAEQVHVKYQIRYDRLPTALFGLARHQLLQKQAADRIAQLCCAPGDTLPRDVHFNVTEYQRKLSDHQNEAIGCVRFIASLSRVDGFVLLDKSLVVHGFGVEAVADSELTDVYLAADAKATPRLLRQATLSQFGTRHRAMVRYCHRHLGSLGFVISQDGDIGAVMRVKDRLILWENVNVEIGFRRENRVTSLTNFESVTSLFRFWSQSLTGARTA